MSVLLSPYCRGLSYPLLILVAAGCAGQIEERTFADLRETAHRFESDETDASLGPDLEDYVHYADAHSPALRAEFARWQAATHRISRARRLPNPVVTYAFFIRPVETRVGAQNHRLSIRQSFPWPTQLTAGATAAARRARSAQRRFEARALVIRASVAQYYWELWLIERLRTVRTEQVMLFTQLADISRARIETGAATLAELQQIHLTEQRLRDTVDALDEQATAARASLLSVIGAAQAMDTPIADAPPELGRPAETVEALRIASAEHPAAAALEEMALSEQAQAQSVLARRYPGFTVGLDWIQTSERETATPIEDNGMDPVIVSLGISIPLWQSSFSDEAESARADAIAFRAEAEAGTLARIAAMERSLANLRDARRRVALYEHTLMPQALALHESVLAAYVVGRAGVADLLLAEREILIIREQEVVETARHAREWAALEAGVGRSVSMDEDGPAPPEERQEPVLEPALEQNQEAQEEESSHAPLGATPPETE